MTAISIENVHKSYGKDKKAVHALRGIDLQIEAGEIYGLLGRNGAGKTTLVKILLDIVRPSQGTSSLFGISSRSQKSRHEVGYLPEDHRFAEYQTASRLMVLYGSLSGLSPREAKRRSPALLDMVGLTHAADKKIRTFSKGMKQRLGLAQALIHEPKMLFLDEPTDGVDPVGRADIRRFLEQLKEGGITIFLNSHLLSEVEQICDRVGILDHGQFVRQGTIEELTSTGLIYKLQTALIPAPNLIDRLREIANSVTQEGERGLELRLSSEADIDAVVAAATQSGNGLRHLSEKKMTLEEVFLESVQGNLNSPPAEASGSAAGSTDRAGEEA